MLQPTIFHLTHPKAGSQWIKKVLHELAPERTRLDADEKLSYFFFEPIQSGVIYPTIYTSRSVFDIVMHLKPGWKDPNFLQSQAGFLTKKASHYQNWLRFSVLKRPYRKFFIIRDLRDTLISFYFSMKKTHLIMHEAHSAYRQSLNSLLEEDGILYLMNLPEFSDYGRIQLSWMDDPETLVIKFEDLLETPLLFERIVDHCEINTSRQYLEQVLEQNSFEKLSGRNPGVEDQNSHFRKGVAGDWVDHFTPAVKSVFKEKYGHILVKTGYERSVDW